ncbi:MAG TPA: 30S ribosomal protein S16 [Acidimicrobiales bacterium]|nr:30S ribosomal protein S16 [Acidimicrobiales bacterium]
MAVKLRLMRMGKKKQPTYRVVAADSRKARNGRFIEVVGFYDPRRDPSVVEIDNDKAVEWLRNGAQPTERVEKLLKITGAWETFTGEAFEVVAPVPATPSEPTTEEVPDEAPAEVEAEVEEPVVDEAPVEVEAEVEEPVVDEAPAEVEAEVEEPVVDEAPAEVEEPVADDAPAEEVSADTGVEATDDENEEA